MLRLEDQVCTIEQAQTLKDLGAPQVGCFSWVFDKLNESWALSKLKPEALEVLHKQGWSAYTVAELGYFLMRIDHHAIVKADKKPRLFFDWLSGKYGYGVDDKEYLFTTEAELRAEVIIKLIKEGFITFKKTRSKVRKATTSDKT